MKGLLVALFLARLAPPSMAVEEPSYEVVQQLEGAAVRLYAPYLVAEVVVPGPAEQAGNEAFPILAGTRGQRAADLDAVEQTLLRLSALAEEHPEVVDVEMNPVFARADGVEAVDVRLRVAPM